ncbi:phosphatase PAP2 family protein [Rhizobium sp. LjRoot258]|uniref:phosphatase PAP2 family protein n=1 Tax=Rhizobium sp. LjRoot258 TaxID=3342299 RepID=UPI003ECEC2D5
MTFLPAERFIILIIATFALLDAWLLFLKGVVIDVTGYASLIACGAFLLGLGQFYRHVRRNDRIAVTAIAAGLFVLFTIVGSIFNYLLLPLRFQPIDPVLARFDAAIGFHWPDFVTWASQYPSAGIVLQMIYATSLPQLVVILLILGLGDRTRLLHHFLMTGVIGALMAIICWFFFPSFGASSIYGLSPAVTEAVPLAVGPHYGAQLVELGRNGATYLTPRNALGLIGFPSFHTVMAAMSACFMMRCGPLGLPFLLLNVLMMPAILIQGGHNLSDVLGGLLVFGVAYALADAALRQLGRTQRQRRTGIGATAGV